MLTSDPIVFVINSNSRVSLETFEISRSCIDVDIRFVTSDCKFMAVSGISSFLAPDLA